MMRFCPNCETERPVDELFCSQIVDGKVCDWPLSGQPIRAHGWRPEQAALQQPNSTPDACPNGHSVEPGDIICPVCGADLEARSSGGDGHEPPPAAGPDDGETIVAGWRLLARLPTTSQVRERYRCIHVSDEREAILTLYADGSEPDPEVYVALRSLDRAHVPEILETGRWLDRAYEVAEDVGGGTLADVGLSTNDMATVRQIVQEVGQALAAIADCGLRHRDLRPGAILVRAREPLDLVVAGFGSAQLSDHDLDIVAPLEITRYTAPEAVAGGVAAASDWWSLGMLLLEQATRGQCFAGADDQTFLISVLTNGAPIPEGLPPALDSLLRGLLALDRRKRWTWPEIRRWLDGDIPEAPARPEDRAASQARLSIPLGSERFATPERFALAAAQADRWEDARALLIRGDLATWLSEAGQGSQLQQRIRAIAGLTDVSEDFRLALALKTMNPFMPLVVRGEIITPGWLVDHPDEGYSLITGPVPDRLGDDADATWLGRLKRRERRVRERSQQLEIELDEGLLRSACLSTSRSRLSAVWDERRRVLPDTDHPGLLAIVERRVTEDEDLILLLAAASNQFRAAEAIVDEAAEAAAQAGLSGFDREAALQLINQPRRDLHQEIERRLEGFARSGHERIDQWADQFRLEKRLPLARSLALLAVPQERWVKPPGQTYVATLLDFYARRITSTIMRGPLTRMIVGKTSARLDLMELDSPRRKASELLNHILLRNDQKIEIDPQTFSADDRIERRLRTLHSHSTLYRRDTGIDGLYLGFPFLVMQEQRASVRPRIAPILLWPIKLEPQVGARGRVLASFDRDREEVRLNPAFETLLGVDATAKWKEVATEILQRSTVTATEVTAAFAEFGAIDTTTLEALPSKDIRVKPGDDRIVCAAAVFHLGFFGQAVMEDLRHLRALSPVGSSLETAFRVGEQVPPADPVRAPELERYFTSDSDPSQEAAVMEARAGRGLLVEGPPGTGKSQTIVNMVADAIGRGRSLLVVCQKQAALGVVFKRLEAAGLGERIVMIQDVNKDREPTIRAIREQLEDLFQNPRVAVGWPQQRTQTAARIETLERELDEHHQALHAADEQTGLSYRLIVGDLIGLADEELAAIPVPSLRQVLGRLDPGSLALLVENCAPTARAWLPAHFENSPLASTLPFGSDEGSIAAFTQDMERFVAAEIERVGVIDKTPTALNISDPAPHEEWLRSSASLFQGLAPKSRQRLANWLDWMAGASEREHNTHPIQEEFAALEQALKALPKDDASLQAVEAARSMDDAALARWKGVSDRLQSPPSFFEKVSPGRWLASGRRRRLMKSSAVTSEADLAEALARETRLRPLRKRLESVLERIGEAVDLGPLRVSLMIDGAREKIAVMAAVEELVRLLETHPDRQSAYAMAKASSEAAVDEFLTRMRDGLARHAAREKSRTTAARLSTWMSPEFLHECLMAIETDQSNAGHIVPLMKALPHLAPYQRFRVRVPQMGGETMDVFSHLARIRDRLEQLQPSDLEPMVRNILNTEARLAWKARLESAAPALHLDAQELSAKAASLAGADKDMRRLNRRLLVEGLNAGSIKPLRAWEDITRLRGVRSRRLREFMELGADLGLMTLRPVWLVNPDVASRLLPLRKALFDSVIFDEASQMPIEYALPTLFRSSRMIVSGDEKQMPPTSFFSSKVESDEAEVFDGNFSNEDLDEEERVVMEETWNKREIKDCPDLLQLAKTVLPATTLQVHYRSIYRELIQFSNAAFYRNALSVPARQPTEEIKRRRPVELVRVDGVYQDQTNPLEARRVVEILRDIWAAGGPCPTIGVVTFNRKQADLIEDVLEEMAESDAGFRVALSRERERLEGGEDMGLFVKNVENVQGDERDIIIFSSTFGRNEQGTFRRSFGVLGQTGGERRLNVAVTRARQKVILVTSMPIPLISDLLATRRQVQSPRDYLQAYFEYARALSDDDFQSADALLARLTSEQRRTRPVDANRDGLEQAVAEEIRALGWEPVGVRDDGAFGLDFAIEDPRTGLFGLGIECDAPRHPLLDNARAREIWRPAVLRRSIPAIHRVSSHRWFHDPTTERELLRKAVVDTMGVRQ